MEIAGPAPAPLRIGLCGLGTVGSAVAQRLQNEGVLLEERAGRGLQLHGVAVRDRTKQRALQIDPNRLVGDALELAVDPEVDVIVETIGGAEIAADLVRQALRHRKAVITANKLLMATAGVELLNLARDCGVYLLYEAAVGAGLPMLRITSDTLRGDRVLQLDAIVNGTTNFILSELEKGVDFQHALAAAQALGFAEADAGQDIDGWDAAYKLAILARHAFAVNADAAHIRRQGIGALGPIDLRVAKKYGYRIKLLAHAEARGEKVFLSVRPTFLPLAHQLSSVTGPDNALLLQSDLQGTTMLWGAGAGGASTSSAILNDLIAVARGEARAPALRFSAVIGDDAEIERAGYWHLKLRNGVEDLNVVIQQMADRGLEIEDSLSTGDSEVAIFSGKATRQMNDNVLATLDSLPMLVSPPLMLERIVHD